jgi:hypothetical protein
MAGELRTESIEPERVDELHGLAELEKQAHLRQ